LTWESCGACRQAASTSAEHTGSRLTNFPIIAHECFMKDKQFHKASQIMFPLIKKPQDGLLC